MSAWVAMVALLVTGLYLVVFTAVVWRGIRQALAGWRAWRQGRR